MTKLHGRDYSSSQYGDVSLENCACGRPATANGKECGPHYRERLRSVRVETSQKRDGYYDEDSLKDIFGDDSEERLMSDTRGLGAGFRGPDGDLYRKDRKTGESVRIDQADLDEVYLGGPITDET